VGDLNGDGKQDLAVVNLQSNTVSVLLGNGDGSFKSAVNYATGTLPTDVAVGDLNGDGHLDLAVTNSGSNSISLLMGNGDGTFQPKIDLALLLTPFSLAVGDFNGDGKADIALGTGNATTDDMTMLIGNGNGTFGAPVTTVTATDTFGFAFAGTAQSSISAADVNGDGRLDLVVVSNTDVREPFGRGGFITLTEPGSVSVLLGNGDGTFQAPRNSATGFDLTSVVVGDFNGDGRPDFAVNGSSAVLWVFTNTGGGNFTSASITTGAGSLVAGDFNGDGVTDLVLGGAKMYTGHAGGTLQAGASYILGLGSPAAGDFNGDGHLDLAGTVFTSTFTSAVEAWLNNGNGTFQAPTFISGAGVTLSSQATGDFNGDGIPDLVTASGQVALGLGDGRFGDAIALPFPSGSSVAAVDADGNGTVDILVGNPSYPAGQVALWPNSPGYDNRTGGAVGFTLSAPTQTVAGSNTSVTVTAVDALGNPVPGFLGTVDLDFTPAGSTALNLASQYTFTAADNGRHTFLFSNLTQAGVDTLATFAVGMPTVSAPITVVPAPTAKFGFATPASVTAGTSFSFSVTAEDKFGNVETGYTGTVHFTASTADARALVPGDYTFTAADAGVHTFGATLFRTLSVLSPTSPSLTAADSIAKVSSTANLNVLSLAPTSLTMVGIPNLTTAGAALGVTVASLDVYGNVATAYAGTVHFSSSDVQAGLPADYTFTAADGGAHLFFPSLKTAGTQSLAVTDTANPAFASSQSGIVVVPALATVWVTSGLPAATTAGAAQTFTLTTMDSYGNVATNYFGTVHFTSTDGQAVLPVDYTYTAADAGKHTFTATLKTAGNQSFTFADTVSTVLTATQSITVTPASSSSLVVTGFPTTTTAGVSHSVTVTALDAYGNVATGYTGTVAVTSSDPIASLPANYTFTSADAGVHTFTAALKRAGTQLIQAADTLTSSLVGAENGITVNPAAVSQFAISGPASVTKGVGFKITVSAEDAFGNVNAGYRGTVHLSSTDSTGGTQNFTFGNNDNGVHVFSYTFNALGFQTLTIVDTSNSSILGSDIVDVLAQNGGGGGGGGGGP
jgi:hypothetical protein